MATNREPMTDAEVKATRKQVTHLMRHPRQQHPSSPPLIHYALDLERPPLIACESPDVVESTAIPGDVTCPDCMSHEQFPRLAVAPRRDAVRQYNVLMTAADLLSEQGENPEYDRAIVEMASALFGAGPDDSILMTRILRALKEGE